MKSYSNKAKIIVLSLIAVLFFVAGYLLYPKQKQVPDYIFDKSYDISIEDVNAARKPLPFRHTKKPDPFFNLENGPNNGKNKKQQELSGIDLKQLFSEGVINSHTTLKYFKHLESLFGKSTNLADHLEKVRAYLFSHFSSSDAQKLFDTYKKYIECEIDLINSGEYKNLTMNVKSPEDAIAVLRRIQEFRRERLGRELADTLFGAEVKAQEYAFRRASIVLNNDLYGAEKEELIKKLNQDMWGDEANQVEQHPNPYNRYQEKLKIYKKDLAEAASEEERKEKIEAFRKEFFPPEVVKKFDEIDQQMAREEENEKNYRAEERALMSDKTLSPEEKEKKKAELQKKIFGQHGDEFRREAPIRL